MSHKQKTLFQTWKQQVEAPHSNHASVSATTNDINQYNELDNDEGLFKVPRPITNNGTGETEFDLEAGKTWIYPTNFPLRDYQYSIVKESLFKNTMVVLPTGLGKTFIAAVTMYNIYRWYPKGKVVFMAPTKPLVAQQVDSCFKVTGISEEDTTQMTGNVHPDVRKKIWQRKRVFFLTPQVMANDLVCNICPAKSIKCLVIDEAHKALGNHAYCQVVRELMLSTSQFRILALTATPGSDLQAVKQVISNLLISHVELRTEDSADVLPYTHTRDIEKIVVPLGESLTAMKTSFLDIINIYLKRLNNRNAMAAKNPSSLSKFQVLKLRELFSQHPPNNMDKFAYGLTMADFSLCISLYHAYELLLFHGVRPFYNFLIGIINGDKSIPHARSELKKNFEFGEIMKSIETDYIPSKDTINSPYHSLDGIGSRNMFRKKLPGHPKLEKLEEIVLEHFRRVSGESHNTRVMIFSQYRDSVQEITELLNKHQPVVKCMSFIGQATTSRNSAGYSQKHQLKVIEQFRKGGYNTLVSTCVGEEGLDIGEVDLIVCFDSPKSPIRLVQRMGRTGRLRKGRIILLITEGKEEQMCNSSESKKKYLNRTITKDFSFAQFYHNSPLMVPGGVMPVCVKTHVVIKPQKAIIKKGANIRRNSELTEEEMEEFNECFRVEETDLSLLPKSDFVSLKTLQEPKILPKEKSLMSLNDWTLWQDAPQRSYMVSHSLRSCVLTETMELMRYPDMTYVPFSHKKKAMAFNTTHTDKGTSTSSERALNSNLTNWNDIFTNNLAMPGTSAMNEENVHSPEVIVLDDNSADVLMEDSPMIDSVFPTEISSELNQVNLIPETLTLDLNLKSKSSLISLLFDFDFVKYPVDEKPFLDTPPPFNGMSHIKTQDIDNINVKEYTSGVYKKAQSILSILNKKMKAKLKRKSREVGSILFDMSTIETSPQVHRVEKLVDSVHSSTIFHSDNENALPSVSVVSKQSKKVSINANCNKDNTAPIAIEFDIDFDIPSSFAQYSENSQEKDEVPPNLFSDTNPKNSALEKSPHNSCFTFGASKNSNQSPMHKNETLFQSLKQIPDSNTIDAIEDTNNVDKQHDALFVAVLNKSDQESPSFNLCQETLEASKDYEMRTPENSFHHTNTNKIHNLEPKITLLNQNCRFDDILLDDYDADDIFEQLSFSNNSYPENLESSFTQPLKVKDIVFDNMSIPKSKSKLPGFVKKPGHLANEVSLIEKIRMEVNKKFPLHNVKLHKNSENVSKTIEEGKYLPLTEKTDCVGGDISIDADFQTSEHHEKTDNFQDLILDSSIIALKPKDELSTSIEKDKINMDKKFTVKNNKRLKYIEIKSSILNVPQKNVTIKLMEEVCSNEKYKTRIYGEDNFRTGKVHKSDKIMLEPSMVNIPVKKTARLSEGLNKIHNVPKNKQISEVPFKKSEIMFYKDNSNSSLTEDEKINSTHDKNSQSLSSRNKLNENQNFELNKKKMLPESTQLTLTQIVSLIDNTENPNNCEATEPHLHQFKKEVLGMSSEDEVCPTPTKCLKPKLSKFSYRSSDDIEKPSFSQYSHSSLSSLAKANDKKEKKPFLTNFSIFDKINTDEKIMYPNQVRKNYQQETFISNNDFKSTSPQKLLFDMSFGFPSSEEALAHFFNDENFDEIEDNLKTSALVEPEPSNTVVCGTRTRNAISIQDSKESSKIEHFGESLRIKQYPKTNFEDNLNSKCDKKSNTYALTEGSEKRSSYMTEQSTEKINLFPIASKESLIRDCTAKNINSNCYVSKESFFKQQNAKNMESRLCSETTMNKNFKNNQLNSCSSSIKKQVQENHFVSDDMLDWENSVIIEPTQLKQRHHSSNSVFSYGLNEKENQKLSPSRSHKVHNARKNNLKRILSPIDDDDDDFKTKKKSKKFDSSISYSKNKNMSFSIFDDVKPISKPKKSRSKFLLTQAEVSGSETSRGESDMENEDILEESFIDDGNVVESNTEQQAFYLKSIKSCAGLPQKFKLNYNNNSNKDVYSQPFEQDPSYMYDSFCVNDDEVDFESPINKAKLKRKKDFINKSKKRRVITFESSSEEEDTKKDFPVAKPNTVSHQLGSKKNFAEISSVKNTSYNNNTLATSINYTDIGTLQNDVTKKISSKRRNVIMTSSSEDEDIEDNRNNNISCGRSKQEEKTNCENFASVSKIALKEIGCVFKQENKIVRIDSSNVVAKKDPPSPTWVISGNKVIRANNTAALAKVKGEVFSFDISWNLDSEKSTPPASNSLPTNTISTLKTERISTSKQNDSTFKQKTAGYSNFRVNSENKLISNQSTASTSISRQNSENKLISNQSTSSISTSRLNSKNKLISNQSTACTSTARLNSENKLISNQSTANTSIRVQNLVNSSSHKPLVILVDTRQLAGAKAVISSVRMKHKAEPIVMSLSGVDYVVSNRTAVARILDSEFKSAYIPQKLLDKIRTMYENYEKSYVIIETDRRKPQIPSFNNKSGCKSATFAANVLQHTPTKVLYTDTPEETSELLFLIAEKEKKGNFHIDVPTNLVQTNQDLFNFYVSLPYVNTVCALNFLYNYPYIGMFLNSSIDELKKVGFLPHQRAIEILRYVKSDISFLGIS